MSRLQDVIGVVGRSTFIQINLHGNVKAIATLGEDV
jgi:hypothetical protein